MKILVRYPDRDEEREIYRRVNAGEPPESNPVMSGADVIELQQLVRRVPISDLLIDYTMNLVRSTRREEPHAPTFVRSWVTWGIGPRGGQSLILAAKARAALHGRPEVDIEDLRTIAPAVLRHRIVLNYSAEAANQTAESVVARLLEETPITTSPQAHDERLRRVLQS
jgi:MoxR-like ATPase